MKPRWPQNRIVYVFLGVMLLLTFLIVACGDDEEPTAAATAPPTTVAPTTAPTPAGNRCSNRNPHPHGRDHNGAPGPRGIATQSCNDTAGAADSLARQGVASFRRAA